MIRTIINTLLFTIMFIMIISCDTKTSTRSGSKGPIGVKVEIRPKAVIGNKLVKLSGSHDLIMAAKQSDMDSIQVIYYKGSWELLQFESRDLAGDDVFIVTIPMNDLILDVDSIQ